MNNIQDRIFKATEYGIDTLRDIKVNKELWEENNFDGKQVYNLIIDIHETYLKILKGEKEKRKNENNIRKRK